MRKIILYIATSVDGFIAKPDGDIDWLSLVEETGQDYGYTKFISTVDTVIMGRKTYDKVLSFGIDFPHKEKHCYVVSRTEKAAVGNVVFYKNSMKDLVLQLKREEGKNIFVDGGAEIVNEMMNLDLIDEYIVSVLPVFLGSGIPLFKLGRLEMKLNLVNSTSFDKGLVQLHYERIRE